MAPQGDRCTLDATPLSDRQENQRTFWSQIAANLRSCGAKPSSLRAQATPGIQGRCLGSRHTLLLSPRGCFANPRFVRLGQETSGMAQNFIECDREQLLLMSPSLREWLPEN